MRKWQLERKYGGIRKWSLLNVNLLAQDLGLSSGAYDLLVDKEVYYNQATGLITPTGKWVLNYIVPCENQLSYVNVRTNSLSEMANYLLNNFNKNI